MAPAAMVMSEDERAAAEVVMKGAMPEKTGLKGDGTIMQTLSWNTVEDGKDLLFQEKYDWSEHAVSAYPDTIYHADDRGIPTYFVYRAPLPIGCKGGFVYANGNDSSARKWLVAFDCINNRVYAESSPIGATDWNKVEVKLKASGSECDYEDPILHGKVSAEIRPENGITYMFVRFSN